MINTDYTIEAADFAQHILDFFGPEKLIALRHQALATMTTQTITNEDCRLLGGKVVITVSFDGRQD